MPNIIDELRQLALVAENPAEESALKRAANALYALQNVAWQYGSDMRFPAIDESQRERRLVFITAALDKLEAV